MSIFRRAVERALDIAQGEAKPLNYIDSDEKPDPARLKPMLDELAADAFDLNLGRVDYTKVRYHPKYEQYRLFAAALRRFDLDSLKSREEKLAFWLNIYNALTIDGVISLDIKETVREIPRLGFFRRASYVIGGELYSLDDIEHGILRENRRHPAHPLPQFSADDRRAVRVISPMEPRVHFALTCASRSCPAISFYDASKLDKQLQQAAESFLQGGGCDVDSASKKATLSSIFNWYAVDFGGKEGVLRFLAQHHPDAEARKTLTQPGLSLSYAPYNWELNKG
jgi:hypothetical protein